MIKIAVVGAAGRMGRMLIESALADPEIILAAAIVPTTSKFLGVDVGELVASETLGLKLSDSLTSVINTIDAIIDFTTPDYTMQNIALCSTHKKACVIGTTGLNQLQKKELKTLSQRAPIVFSPNMSIGVNLVLQLLETIAKILDEETDIEIIEKHHRHKVDAPSGTALKMGEVIADAINRNLKQCATYSKKGQTGPRKKDTIGFSSVRAGDIIGEHTAMFACDGERIEVSHKASNRNIYAKGALKAVKFLTGKRSGLFNMKDVMGL